MPRADRHVGSVVGEAPVGDPPVRDPSLDEPSLVEALVGEAFVDETSFGGEPLVPNCSSARLPITEVVYVTMAVESSRTNRHVLTPTPSRQWCAWPGVHRRPS